MDVKRVENFFALLENTDINELCLEKDDMKLRLKRGVMQDATRGAAAPSTSQPQPKKNGNGNGNANGNGNGKHAHNGKNGNGDVQPAATPAEHGEQNDYVMVSKMVGTFYRSSDTTGQPWVKEGDEIKKGQRLGLIEAMKIMKEVLSDCDGTLVKILVENGKAVEYGKDMFVIRLGV